MVIKRRAGIEPAKIRSAGERSTIVPPPQYEFWKLKFYLKIVISKTKNF